MAKISATELDAIIKVYRDVNVPTDRLPYTAAFDELRARLESAFGRDIPPTECWHLLNQARKQKKLPRLVR